MITVGISTYKDQAMTEKLLSSIVKKTDGQQEKDYQILVVDDGTPDNNIFEKLQEACNKYGARLLRNDTNRGIPTTWNNIVKNSNSEKIIILNNDLIATDPNWLRCIKYFYDNNDNIGMVGFPTVHPIFLQGIDKTNITLYTLMNINPDNIAWTEEAKAGWGVSTERPEKCGSSVGCCFGILKSAWEKVNNPDGSTGFYESLSSFHEEIHFGFKLSEIGYYNCMIPWPPFVHLGGRTFAANAELHERTVDWSQIEKEVGGNKQEYINTIMKSNVYPGHWKKEGKIVWKNKQGTESVDRMAFSRYQFSKYWNVLSDYDNPAVTVHRRLIDPMPKRSVKFLDKNMEEKNSDI